MKNVMYIYVSKLDFDNVLKCGDIVTSNNPYTYVVKHTHICIMVIDNLKLQPYYIFAEIESVTCENRYQQNEKCFIKFKHFTKVNSILSEKLFNSLQ